MPPHDHPTGLGSDPGFAPEDLTDDRPIGDWRSKYEPEAWKFIWQEVAYLVFLIVAALTMILVVWIRYPQRLLHLSVRDTQIFSRFAFAGLSGTCGGALLAMKWLYHTVAKRTWHMDRRPWRLMTPVISGGLAFFSVAIVQSVAGFDPAVVSTGARASAFGFLIGLFSDNALAKLAEVAETLLGRTRRMPGHPQPPQPD